MGDDSPAPSPPHPCPYEESESKTCGCAADKPASFSCRCDVSHTGRQSETSICPSVFPASSPGKAGALKERPLTPFHGHSQGVKVDARDHSGATARMLAKQYGHMKIVALMDTYSPSLPKSLYRSPGTHTCQPRPAGVSGCLEL